MSSTKIYTNTTFSQCLHNIFVVGVIISCSIGIDISNIIIIALPSSKYLPRSSSIFSLSCCIPFLLFFFGSGHFMLTAGTLCVKCNFLRLPWRIVQRNEKTNVLGTRQHSIEWLSLLSLLVFLDNFSSGNRWQPSEQGTDKKVKKKTVCIGNIL